MISEKCPDRSLNEIPLRAVFFETPNVNCFRYSGETVFSKRAELVDGFRGGMLRSTAPDAYRQELLLELINAQFGEL